MKNVYEKMNARLLKLTLRQHLPVFDGVSSGFHIEHLDSDHATVVWKNAGTDETLHRDMMGRARNVLKRNGYDVRTTKPADTTLMLRQVNPIVTHLPENGLFETMVDTVHDLALEVTEELTRRIDERFHLPGVTEAKLFPKRVQYVTIAFPDGDPRNDRWWSNIYEISSVDSDFIRLLRAADIGRDLKAGDTLDLAGFAKARGNKAVSSSTVRITALDIDNDGELLLDFSFLGKASGHRNLGGRPISF